ncbi:hypothetical protein [Nonomuraea aridisoli]|uniref:hypothetical protein n=1 Tax=Nonomuraea aridisoli TaxID=2070368 RepID=UPI0015E8DCF1|nr:hypothetical protein [Nonomuraea aridisoli]
MTRRLSSLRQALVGCPPGLAWGCTIAAAGVALAALGALASVPDTPRPVVVRTGTPATPFVTVHPGGGR